MTNSTSTLKFKNGLHDGLPVGLGYLSVSFAFGVTAGSMGIPWFISLLTSMTNLTSAGQKAGIEVIAAGGSIGAVILGIILTQLVINARYFLMSTFLTQKLDNSFTLPHRMICSFGITDEIFAIAVAKPKSLGKNYFYGLMTLPYLGWALGTLLGALAGNILPANVVSALNIALYAMFIAIIIPPAVKNKGILAVVILATLLSCAFCFIPLLSQVSAGISYIICAVLSAAIVAIFFPVKNKEEEAE